MWAIGCIFAELLTTRPLFPGKENLHSHFQEEQLDKIFKILGKPTPTQVRYRSLWSQFVLNDKYYSGLR
jgi:serine/threonine protein kinase